MEPVTFPYQPYPQQEQLMQAIVECISSSSIGCFESPTGTGKSMCALYASYSWLLKEEGRLLIEYSENNAVEITLTSSSQSQPKVNEDEEDDWLADMLKSKDSTDAMNDCSNQKSSAIIQNQKDVENFKKARNRIHNRELLNKAKQKSKHYSFNNKTATFSNDRTSSGLEKSKKGSEDEADDNQYALDHYDSSDDKSIKSKYDDTTFYDSKDDDSDSGTDNNNNTSKTVGFNKDQSKVQTTISVFPKIFYCSRTHTQISQFVGEMKKSTFQNIRCITLGSRKNLCIHEDVRGLSDTQLSETCANMQKYGKTVDTGEDIDTKMITMNKKPRLSDSNNNDKDKDIILKKDQYKKCCYHNKSNEHVLSDSLLYQVFDIEDIVVKGQEMKTCPYYSTRRAVQDAQIICLPYNMLLSDEMRDSLGINLKNAIVIIDEAHNLIDTINQINSCEISEIEILYCIEAIQLYMNRYKLILSGKSIYYVKLFLSVVSEIKKNIFHVKSNNSNSNKNFSTNIDISATALAPLQQHKYHQQQEETVEVLDSNEFSFRCGLDNINFFKLLRHIDKSRLVQKMGGYSNHTIRVQEIQRQLLQQKEQQLSTANINNESTNIANMKPITHNQSFSNTNNNNNNNNSNNHIQLEYNTANTTNNENAHMNALRKVVTLIKGLTNSQVDGKVIIKRFTNNNNGIKSINSSDKHSNNNSTATSLNFNFNFNITSNPSQLQPASSSSNITSANAANSIATTTSSSSSSSTIQFAMLNPSIHFNSIVQDAKSIVLLGGTLQPFHYLLSQLFPQVPRNKIRTFACDHIVPTGNVLALVISTSPSSGSPITINKNTVITSNSSNVPSRVIELTHSKKSSPETLHALFTSTLSLAQLIPNGIVSFFTSYAYMKLVIDAWDREGWLNELKKVKSVFIEPRNASDSEKVWNAYNKCAVQGCCANNTSNGKICNTKTRVSYDKNSKHGDIHQQNTSITSTTAVNINGAILFCVIGGKLSEGINFSDELARGVIVMGLPYPDRRDALLTMKLNYADALQQSTTRAARSGGSDIGNINDNSSTLLDSANRGKAGFSYLCSNKSMNINDINNISKINTSGTTASVNYNNSNNKHITINKSNNNNNDNVTVTYRNDDNTNSSNSGNTNSINNNNNNNSASNELYEAMCMKAVNQSVGRAIRHINDYAVIILLDCRYTRAKTIQLLPQWISRSLTCCDHFHTASGKINDFFVMKNKEKEK